MNGDFSFNEDFDPDESFESDEGRLSIRRRKPS